MTAFTVLFYIVMSIPGQHPIMHDHASASLAECIDEARDALTRMTPPSDGGGTVQAGCVIKYEATVGG